MATGVKSRPATAARAGYAAMPPALMTNAVAPLRREQDTPPRSALSKSVDDVPVVLAAGLAPVRPPNVIAHVHLPPSEPASSAARLRQPVRSALPLGYTSRRDAKLRLPFLEIEMLPWMRRRRFKRVSLSHSARRIRMHTRRSICHYRRRFLDRTSTSYCRITISARRRPCNACYRDTHVHEAPVVRANELEKLNLTIT